MLIIDKTAPVPAPIRKMFTVAIMFPLKKLTKLSAEIHTSARISYIFCCGLAASDMAS
jgi:hypothetical protein